jgi:uncharacterized protein (DUF1800 family)
VPAWQTWVNDQSYDGTINAFRVNSFKKWWAGLMINQDRSIREKMTLFWANHWGTETTVIFNAVFIYKHHATLRAQSLGNFRSMVKGITMDPGMLRYLNGYLNTNTAPDENYARELQELFTIGKDPITNLAPYSEDDVKAAARILTGWRIDNVNGVGVFDPSRHDASAKSFSSFYNNAVIAGRSGVAGEQETDDLINMLFAKDETSLHIVRKLYRWFVYYDIDANTEQNVIVPLAAVFRQNNFEIKPVLSALFKSEHFFDMLNRGCFIKTPCDFLIGHLREFSVQFPSLSDLAGNYGHWNLVKNGLTVLTQDLGDPPNVSGWPAYYQGPQFHELWINHNTLPRRNQLTDFLILTGSSFNGTQVKTNPVAFASAMPNPADPNELVADSVSFMLGLPLTAASMAQIKTDFLLSGQSADYYWTTAWQNYISNPSTTNYNIIYTRLRNMYKYLMNLSEYQLC